MTDLWTELAKDVNGHVTTLLTIITFVMVLRINTTVAVIVQRLRFLERRFGITEEGEYRDAGD